MTSLHLFGNLELTDREGHSVPLQAKRGAILAYLAAARPGPWHRRDTIVALFWPESDEERARSALSKAVYYLRHAGGADLVLGRGDQELGLSSSGLWCDVSAFEGAIGRGALEEAAALYRGRLLEGFHLPGAPDFGHWLDTERSRLHRHALDAVWGLVDEVQSAGNHAEATKWARQALLWSPTDETGLRRLLTLLHGQGKRTEALRAYDSFQARCRDEYGIEPSDETDALIDAIRDGSLPTRTAFSPTVSKSLPADEGLRESSGGDGEPTGEPTSQGDAGTRSAWGQTLRERVGWVGLPAALLVTVFAIAAGGNRTADPETALGTTGEKQRIVLAHFRDATGENLGNVVTGALRVDLLEASNIALAEAADISPTLRLMRINAGATLTAELAREVALREGIGAVIDGDVASAGAGYIVTATLRDSETGRAVASFRVTAEGPNELIAAIDQLSTDLRAKSGESLRSIQAGDPLERATTSSLEALKLYTEAERARNIGDSRRSIQLLEHALVRDSTFAMAWRLLFISSRDTAAASKAFQLRERLSDLERHVVEGLYYDVVAGDRSRSVAAYERALNIDPSELRALNNLAGHLMYRGDLEGGRDLYLRAVEGGRSTILPRLLLWRTRIDLGAFEDASAAPVIQDATPDSDARSFAFDLAFGRGDLSEAARFQGDRSGGAARLDNSRDATNQARLALWTGRLDEARSLLLRVEELDGPGGWNRRIGTALTEVLVGDPVWGRRHITEAQREDRPPPQASLALAFSGDPNAAQSLLDCWTTTLSAAEKAKPNVAHEMELWALFARVARGDTVGVVGAFERLTVAEECADSCWPSLEARLHDALGHYDQAIELHERMLRPGYNGWGAANIDVRLYSMLRLGPLYEEIGDTAKAIGAYQRVVDQWADADARGRETVGRFRERITALGG